MPLAERRRIQQGSTPLDVGEWRRDEDFAVHPIGSKPKRMLFCPDDPPAPYLIGGHAYLFKSASGWRAQQLWSEVIAYRMSLLIGIAVPPCFVAYDSEKGEVGALIEFFYGYPDETHPVRFVHAVDVLHRLKMNSKRDRQGVRTNVTICRRAGCADAAEWWGKILTFDALIGNTDRHTENWGFLVRRGTGEEPAVSLCPAYDNGTSLGYECPEDQLARLTTPQSLAAYIAKGRHNCGWDSTNNDPAPHVELCGRFASAYPEARSAMLSVLQFSKEAVQEILLQCTSFDIGVRFSPERAEFVLSLVEARRQRLLSVLEVAA